MGKVYLRATSYDVFVAEIDAEVYERLTDEEELEYALDIEISNALSDVDYELFYREDK